MAALADVGRDVRRVVDRVATSAVELKPLLALCREGRVFEVQDWIAAGNPVNLPPTANSRCKSPLRVALESGVHSLVQALLRGGAEFEACPWKGSMAIALTSRRADLAKLLVEHGYDVSTVDMASVFDTWNPDLIDYFLNLGADVERGNPLTNALDNGIWMALRVLRRDRDRFPSFRSQANRSLRNYVIRRDAKWVSNLLAAGADPLASGPYDIEGMATARDDDEGATAVELAALWDFFDLFKMKQVRLDVTDPLTTNVAKYACKAEGIELLTDLLARGWNPNDLENGGSSAVQSTMERIGFNFERSIRFSWLTNEEGIDTEKTRGNICAGRLLMERGARWVPCGRSEVESVRKNLLKLTPTYTAEFVLILSRNRACAKDTLVSLLAAPKIKAHIARHESRIGNLLEEWR
jgi:hypothetical protein